MEIFSPRILGGEVFPGFIAYGLRLSRAGPRDEKQASWAIPWRFSKTVGPPIRSIMRGPALGLVEQPGSKPPDDEPFHYGMLHHAHSGCLDPTTSDHLPGDPSDPFTAVAVEETNTPAATFGSESVRIAATLSELHVRKFAWLSTEPTPGPT